jgi:uncharacterized lipoprotein YajG
MKWRLLAFLSVAIGLQAGCVTGRRMLVIPTTKIDTPAAAVRGHVYISAVTDDRQFQNKPPDPSTPSIDGDVTKLSAQQKDMMVGRQRNGYGHAMGDIALAAGDTVTLRTRHLVEQGLRQQGYEVVSDPSAANSVAVSIAKFWGWSTPGFFALTFETQLECNVSVTNRSGAHTVAVKGYALNHGQFAKDENWLEAFEPAFQDFVTNLSNATGTLGLLTDESAASRP